MMATAFTNGQHVRFTASRLGLVKSEYACRVEPEVAKRGDAGVYLKRADAEHLADEDWHVVQVGALLCICHRSHFEVVA